MAMPKQGPQETVVAFLKRVGASAQYLLETTGITLDQITMMLARKLSPEIEQVFRSIWQMDWSGPKTLNTFARVSQKLMEIERFHADDRSKEEEYVTTTINKVKANQNKSKVTLELKSQEEKNVLIRVVQKMRSDQAKKQVENLLSEAQGGTTMVQALTAKNSQRSRFENRGFRRPHNTKCFHCGKDGHFKRDCPEWRKLQEEKVDPNTKVQANIVPPWEKLRLPFCLVCGKYGHTASVCWHRAKEPPDKEGRTEAQPKL